MYKSKVMIVFFLMILVINIIVILNLLFFKDQVNAYGEKKEKRKYQNGDYKIYNDYLVQDPLNYGTIESEDQNYHFEKQFDHYGELSEQQKSLYLNPSDSKCPKCTDIKSTGYIDLDSLISVLEEHVDDEVSIHLTQLFNEIEYDLNAESVFDIICDVFCP
jgi:hypothetical protein